MTSVTFKRCRYVVAVIVKLKLECFDSQHAKQCFHFTWICHNWATLTTSGFAYTYINISNKSRHDLCITRIIIHPISGLLWDVQTCNLCVCVFSFTSRWSEVTRRLELWVQVMELNEAGVFAAVEVVPAKDVRTGGVFQLRQVASDRLCLSGFSPFFKILSTETCMCFMSPSGFLHECGILFCTFPGLRSMKIHSWWENLNVSSCCCVFENI